jgi:hypothetical protein
MLRFREDHVFGYHDPPDSRTIEWKVTERRPRRGIGLWGIGTAAMVIF